MCLKNILRIGFLFIFILFEFSALWARDRDNVLVINSYTDVTVWSNYVIDSLRKDPSIKEDILVESLNMLLVEEDSIARQRKRLIIEKHSIPLPRCIVVLGSPAWCLFEDAFCGVWKDVPIIFCVQEDYVTSWASVLKKKEIVPGEMKSVRELIKGYNATVVECPIHVRRTIDEMKLLLPGMEKVVLISDHRYVSAQVRYEMREVCQKYFPDLQVSYFTEGEMTMDDMLDSISSFDINKVGLLYFSWFQREGMVGNKYISCNNHKTISTFDHHPVFILEDIGIEDGELAGGYFYSGQEFGHTVARTLREIMAGKSPKDVAWQQVEPDYYLCYNVLQKAGIPTSIYPDNAHYFFVPESFWSKNRYMIFVVAVLLFSLYLMWERIRLMGKERSLHEKELSFLKKYETLFNNMPIAYTRHKLIYNSRGELEDYVVQVINPMFCKYFKDGENIVGKRGSEILNSNYKEYLVLYKTMLAEKKSFTIEYYHKAIEKYFEVLLVASEQVGMIDVFCVDITDLRNTRALLESVNYKLAMALDVANIIPWRWNLEDGTMLCDVNRPIELQHYQGGEDTLSVPQEQYFSKIHKDDRERVRAAYSALIEGKVEKIKEEYRVLDRNNHHYSFEWVEAQAAVEKKDKNGKALSLVGSSLVITGRKKMELDLREAKEHAEESNRLKSAFLANMSHEIRTPLNAIVGFSNILASAEEEREKQEYVNIIENNNKLLLQLINDILDLSKIESGSMEFVYSDFDLNALLRELEQTSALRLTTSAVEIVFEEGLPECCIHMEKNRLTQVIANLINNATKFTEKGSIRFGYHLLEKNTLYFYVTDTGCGISADKKEAIFERFVKLNSFAQGTGLGLPICKTIVERMGGKIGVESETGNGSTFWFTVPYNPVKLHHEENKKDEFIIPEAVEKDKLKILIAEDNPSNYMLFESILKKDYKLLHAWNGVEAVNLFEEHRPHLVLMDINMPELNGYEAVQKIRKISSTVPVIAVTAYAYASDEEKIMSSGFDAYAAKPINANALKSKIIHLLEKRIILL